MRKEDYLFYKTKQFYYGMQLANDMVDLATEAKEKMDSFLRDYKSQITDDLFTNIIESDAFKKSDDLVNNMLNFAHTYAIDDNVNAAILIYKKFDMTYLLKEYDIRIKEVIEKDLKDFLSQKLISQTSYNKIISSLN